MANYYSSIMFIAIALASLLFLFNLGSIFEEAKDTSDLQLSPGDDISQGSSGIYFLYTLIASTLIAILIAYFIKITISMSRVY